MIDGSPTRWRARRFVLPEEREDEAVAALWAAGALGFETRPAGEGEVELVAWSGVPVPEALVGIDPSPWRGRPAGEEERGDEDWLLEYRRRAAPFDVGRGFRVDPRDPEDVEEVHDLGGDPDGDGRRRLRIPARTAFGTGSHESTRLAVELLEELELEGRRILDVGTGTGILSFVALALGAAGAIGFDVDPASPPVARENGVRNGLSPVWFAGRVDAISPAARFDVVVVNALPHEVAGELSDLVARLDRGGLLVVSGVPTEQRSDVETRLEALGCGTRRRLASGEWVAIVAEWAGAPGRGDP